MSSHFNIVMPKLGESIQEATITKWLVKEGDMIAEDDILFEVATDKVDSEIPSPVDGIIQKIFYLENSTVPVGELLAIVNTSGENVNSSLNEISDSNSDKNNKIKNQLTIAKEGDLPYENLKSHSNKFFSPLVKKIAYEEKITLNELETIKGSGENGRVQKDDLLKYIENRKAGKKEIAEQVISKPNLQKISVLVGAGDQIIEMDRVRKIIASHMVMSKQVSPHVTTVVEADVTNLVFWREKSKDVFLSKYGEKITYMHVFTEAVAKALSEFPLLNSSVDGDKIILKKNINIGIAVAKPDGNLIVPVIKNAEQRNLVGLSKELNRLANSARNNKLLPEEIQDGTFTITNFGTFRNLIGTPIINQPQVAILATGSIEKKPAVMETPTGDAIVVRHKMFLSLSYDHRIIDGALGGAFLRRIADILEEFDINRSI